MLYFVKIILVEMLIRSSVHILNGFMMAPVRVFEVAVYSEKVIGIEHNIKAPVLINNECTMVTVLHDLMVDENHRGTVGFRLMQDSLKRDNYLVLPGSVGRLSRTYGKLGSKKFASFWVQKVSISFKYF